MDKSPVPSLTDALAEAIEIIRSWHGDGPADAWDIYYEHSPEMKRLRSALAAGSPSTVPSEPVAWRYRYHPGDNWRFADGPAQQWAADHSRFEEEPLFVHPTEHSGTAVQRPAPSSEAKHAVRYRWLREQIKSHTSMVYAQAMFWNNGSRGELDKAIDRAMVSGDPVWMPLTYPPLASEPDASPSPTEPSTRSAGEGSIPERSDRVNRKGGGK